MIGKKIMQQKERMNANRIRLLNGTGMLWNPSYMFFLCRDMLY